MIVFSANWQMELFLQEVFMKMKMCIRDREYTRYDMKLTAAEDCHEAQLTISCKEGGEVLLGFISLMPDNTYMGHGLRTDLVEKLKGMSPKFMRFPGGCIVEGTTPSTACLLYTSRCV